MKVNNVEISNFNEVVLNRRHVWEREQSSDGNYTMLWKKKGSNEVIDHEVMVGMIKAFTHKKEYKVVESVGTINIFHE